MKPNIKIVKLLLALFVSSGESSHAKTRDQIGRLIVSSDPASLGKLKKLLKRNPGLNPNIEAPFSFLHEAQCTDSQTLLSLLPLEAESELTLDPASELKKQKLEMLKRWGARLRNCLTLGKSRTVAQLKLRKSPSIEAQVVSQLDVTPAGLLIVSGESDSWLRLAAYYPSGAEHHSIGAATAPLPSKGIRLYGWVPKAGVYWNGSVNRRPEGAKGELQIDACSINQEYPFTRVIDENSRVFVIGDSRTFFGCGGG